MEADIKLTVTVPDPDETFIKAHQRAMQSYPNKNGLFLYEVVAIWYAGTFTTSEAAVCSFWKYKYGIDNIRPILNRLLTRGFIEIEPLSESLSRQKIPELKEYLREAGLPVSGKKADLITRLVQNTTAEYIESKIQDRSYCQTALGKAEMDADENEYIFYFHRNKVPYGPDINVWWMNEQLHQYPNRNYRDLIWAGLNQKTQDAIKEMANGNYFWYIQNREVMGEFLLEEERYRDALRLLVEAAYYKANFDIPTRYWYALQNRDIIGGEILIHISEDLYLRANKFKTVKEKLDEDDDTFFQDVHNIISGFQSSKAILSSTELAWLIISQIDGNQERVTAICQKMEQIIEQNYQQQKKQTGQGVLPAVEIPAQQPASSLMQKIIGIFSKK